MLRPHRLSLMLLPVLLLAAAGCCAPCGVGDCGMSSGCGGAGAPGLAQHRPVLRRGTLPPPVPPPAAAAPIARYHPLPTHPVFETQASYQPLVPIVPQPPLLPPPPAKEPTPALLPVPGK